MRTGSWVMRKSAESAASIMKLTMVMPKTNPRWANRRDSVGECRTRMSPRTEAGPASASGKAYAPQPGRPERDEAEHPLAVGLALADIAELDHQHLIQDPLLSLEPGLFPPLRGWLELHLAHE